MLSVAIAICDVVRLASVHTLDISVEVFVNTITILLRTYDTIIEIRDSACCIACEKRKKKMERRIKAAK